MSGRKVWAGAAGLVALWMVAACGSSNNSRVLNGGTGGAAGSSNLPCRNSLDCVHAGQDTVCDPATGSCVECLTVADCPPNNDCTGHRCVAYTPCQNSLACPKGQVCDSGRGRCVQCVQDADCGGGQRCWNEQCHTACQSDKQCTPLGQLCNQALGICVQCVGSNDCPSGQACVGGKCTGGSGGPGGTGTGGTGTGGAGTGGSGGSCMFSCTGSAMCTLYCMQLMGGDGTCVNSCCSCF